MKYLTWESGRYDDSFFLHLLLVLILTTDFCPGDASIGVWRLLREGVQHDCSINLKVDLKKSVPGNDVNNTNAIAEYMRHLEKGDVTCCYPKNFEMRRGPDGFPNTCHYDENCKRHCRRDAWLKPQKSISYITLFLYSN